MWSEIILTLLVSTVNGQTFVQPVEVSGFATQNLCDSAVTQTLASSIVVANPTALNAFCVRKD